jgi:hypothetical protein
MIQKRFAEVRDLHFGGQAMGASARETVAARRRIASFVCHRFVLLPMRMQTISENGSDHFFLASRLSF